MTFELLNLLEVIDAGLWSNLREGAKVARVEALVLFYSSSIAYILA
jgi:hypothetical protein